MRWRVQVAFGLLCACVRARGWGSVRTVRASPPSPEAVSGTGGGSYLSSGTSRFACIGQDTCAVRCWGEAADDYGLLGARPEISLDAREVPSAFGSLQITRGDNFACAIGAGGQVSCTGSNLRGQLGDGTLKDHLLYARVVGLPRPATQVGAAGIGNACAIAASRVYCWGSNLFGQLGDGTTEDRPLPVQVKGLEAVSAIAVGRKHVCVLNQSGTIDCWGSNARGGLGDAAIAPWS